MYWATPEANGKGTITRAWMDGTHRANIVAGMSWPRGLTINFNNSRLYWSTHKPGKKLMSSTLLGKDTRPAVSMLRGGFTFGIGFWKDKLYYTDRELRTVKHVQLKNKKSLTVAHRDRHPLLRLVVVPRVYPSTNRKNDCKNNNCDNLCVLSSKSSACLSVDGRVEYSQG